MEEKTYSDDSDGVRLELYVRSLSPRGTYRRQEALIERLERLSAAGRIDDYSVEVWGRRVAFSTAAARTEAGKHALARHAVFKRWADANDRSIGSFFEVRTVDSKLADERYRALIFPGAALAEYRDGELRHVAPCSDGGTVYTVEDRLDRFEQGAPRVEESPASGASVPTAPSVDNSG